MSPHYITYTVFTGQIVVKRKLKKDIIPCSHDLQAILKDT